MKKPAVFRGGLEKSDCVKSGAVPLRPVMMMEAGGRHEI
jgi:hypothetical protein